MIGYGDKMNKIKDKSFWLILIISIIGLVALIIGIIFLTRKGEKEFYSAGYIINSTASASSKLYFDDNTVYKENVFNEYVFTNKDGKEVSTSKDNFIHYLDNSLSFMKNGVILDLDNFNETLVPYYNITDKSIIKYNNGGYYVETADKNLIFGNFLGRITENKYIVVGKDIKIKLAGNNDLVSGNYFEILFVEDGIVKIENQEGSYQTISDGTTIYVGDNIKIDLGDKTVKYGDTTKLNLTEMTIDGNENIDITPTGKVKEEEKESGNDTNNPENNTGENPGDNGTTGEDGNNNGNGNDGNSNDNTPTSVIKKEVSVDLVNAKVEANNITANFQVIDTADFIKGNLVLNLKNVSTGETVYSKLLSTSSDIQTVNIGSLSPDCNYYMTITEENNVSSTQYFQKAFKTENLDLTLNLEMATTEALSYSLDFGTSSDIKSANIGLYDSDDKPVGEVYTIYNGGDNIVTFHELNKNTTYKVKVDSVVFKNTNYASIYTINSSDTTLKEKPVLGDISVDIDSDGQAFSLKMSKPTDEDKSITKYIYEIYDASKITEENINTIKPIYTFTSNELKTEVVSVGKIDALNGITDFRYKVVAEYYDNYKYGEIESGFSNYFKVVGKPVLEFSEEEISFNEIKGTVKIKDSGCTISLEGRECFNEDNNFIIRYYSGDTVTRKTIDNVIFTENNNTLEYELSLSTLTENTVYTFEVYANVDFHDGNGVHEGQYIGNFTVTTKGIDSLKVQDWKQNNYSYDTPISVSGELASTVADSESFNDLATITFNLYRGDVKNNAYTKPIGTFTVDGNIKDMYDGKPFTVTSNMFDIENLDDLREKSGGSLSRYYTIEITDAYDITKTNEFIILNNMYVFETPSILLLEDEVSAPEIVVDQITNIQAKSSDYAINYDSKLGDNIVVGYKVSAIFEKNKMENYFTGSNPVTKINFYAYDQNNMLVGKRIIDLTTEDNYTTYFYLGYGTEYSETDKDLRRGNRYSFAYDISIDTNNDGEDDTVFPSNRPTSEKYLSSKQDPSFALYIDNSDKNSITYKYKITDYDNALYYDEDNYYFYYKVNDSEEEYKSPIEKSDDYLNVKLPNLEKDSIYSLSYSRATTKVSDPSKVILGNYYFEGEILAKDYNLGYNLEYGNFDNRLKLILADSELLSRISAYLVTLDAGNDKYQTVISNLSTCEEDKCIIIDYADIAKLKGKNIKVSLVGFYDTGYIGFSQKSKLGSYFESMNLVDSSNSDKLGFVYQTTGLTEPGKYIYTTSSGAYVDSLTPKGILGFELFPSNTKGIPWKLTTNNIVDTKTNSFVPYGTIVKDKASVQPTLRGIYVTSDNSKYTLNPKVLDKVNIQTSNDDFKFTSITPKVSSTSTPFINGATVKVNLSIDEETLNSDFIKTNGKYKFYIDIYTKDEETGEFIPAKTVETDYDNISEVTFQGLNPATTYYYRISADMNKNGQKVKTELFDYNRSGYVVYQNTFATLNKEKVLNRVTYNYDSKIDGDIYSKRTLNFRTYLRTKENFDIKYQIFDINDELEYEYTVANANITEGNNIIATYNQDISGKDFVFGSDYHTLIVKAVTTDLGKELELFNEKLTADSMTKLFHELNNPTFSVTPEAIIEKDGTYSISSRIVVNDEDKVITDGKYYIELQEATSSEGYVNACISHEDDCRATVDIINDGTNITKKFTNLKPNTGYVIYVYADTYRNNVSLTEKDNLVYVRKTQYTKSDIGFSLGLVTPTAVSKSKLVITFTGSSNLTNSLKGIEYSINVQGGEKVTSGKIGKTSSGDTGEIMFTLSGEYPSIEITMPNNKYLGNNNYILITYYYEDTNGDLVALNIGGKTVNSYGVIYNG